MQEMLSLPAPIGVGAADDEDGGGDGREAPFRVVIGTLAVSDILVCVELSPDELLALAAEQEAVASGSQGAHVSNVREAPAVVHGDTGDGALAAADFVYNPVLELLDYTPPAPGSPFSRIDSGKVYVPMVAIERKRVTDLGASIGGKSDKPGFSRYKDQKLRLKALQHLTGCTLMVVVEQYHKHYSATEIGGVSEEAVRTAIVNTMLRDKIFVDTSSSELDTVRVLRKVAEQLVDKQFCNFTFPRVFVAARDAVRRGLLVPPPPQSSGGAASAAAGAASVLSERRAAFDEQLATIALAVQPLVLDSVRATQKLVGAHSDIVSVRKRDNKNPKLCYQMMLMCVHGISQPVAAAIMRRYPTMPDLVRAYESAADEAAARRTLADIELGTTTGKRRRLGPAKSAVVYEMLYARSAEHTKARPPPTSVAAKAGKKRPTQASTAKAGKKRPLPRDAQPKGAARKNAKMPSRGADFFKKSATSSSSAAHSAAATADASAAAAAAAAADDDDDDDLLRSGQV